MYRFSGVKAIEIPASRFDEMAQLVEAAMLDISRAHGKDVQVHFIPIMDDGTNRGTGSDPCKRLHPSWRLNLCSKTTTCMFSA